MAVKTNSYFFSFRDRNQISLTPKSLTCQVGSLLKLPNKHTNFDSRGHWVMKGQCELK